MHPAGGKEEAREDKFMADGKGKWRVSLFYGPVHQTVRATILRSVSLFYGPGRHKNNENNFFSFFVFMPNSESGFPKIIIVFKENISD